MTSEGLVEIVFLRGLSDLVEALSPLDEKARRRLSKTALELNRGLVRGGKIPIPSHLLEPVKEVLAGASPLNPPPASTTAALAVLGTGSLSQARRVEVFLWKPEQEDALMQILRDRRPPWMELWIEHSLDHGKSVFGWRALRAWIRHGVCRKPRSDGYVQLMVRDLSQWRDESSPPLSRRLLDDPELLDDEVWRLFKVATRAFNDEVESNPYAPSDVESWAGALVRLAGEGRLDRQRLLDASLSALTRGFHSTGLSGFHKLHLRLKPTVEELEARQVVYRGLLTIPVGHVVDFALKMLGRLERAHKLDVAPCLDELEPVFELAVKGPALRALRLVRRVAGRHSELRPRAQAQQIWRCGPATMPRPSAGVPRPDDRDCFR